MEKEFNVGDYVRHINPIINGGAGITIEKVDQVNKLAHCSHFEAHEFTHKVEWFQFSELRLL